MFNLRKLILTERKRLLLSEHDLSGFQTDDDRELFVKARMKEAGFDVARPYSAFKGTNVSAVLFEQE